MEFKEVNKGKKTIDICVMIGYYIGLKSDYKETCLRPTSIGQVNYKFGKCMALIDMMFHMEMIEYDCWKKETKELNDLMFFAQDALDER